MVDIVTVILQSLYFFLPAYFANMAPVMTKKIPFLIYRIDFGRTFRGKPLFGKNKTFRGLFFGVVFAMGIAFIQFQLYSIAFFQTYSIIDYSNWYLIGFLLGFGAILGDAIESFFKRQLDYPPGKPFIPFDQLDFVIGGLVVVSFAIVVPVSIWVTLILVSGLLHIAVNHIAFYTGIRKEKW